MTAVSLLLAGANILVIRHPGVGELVRKTMPASKASSAKGAIG